MERMCDLKEYEFETSSTTIILLLYKEIFQKFSRTPAPSLSPWPGFEPWLNHLQPKWP